ncbi:MAG: hypothetical protein QXZ59_04575, partial [Nitrososphaeria archaeon]
IERPFGVTILAILTAINAIVYFGLAAFVGVIFAWIGELIPRALTGLLAIIAMVVSVIAVIFGLIYLLLAWGLWSGKGWAWTITLILTILSLLGSLITAASGFGIVSLIINVLILYYLTRPHVKAFFGKGPPPEMPPPPPP